MKLTVAVVALVLAGCASNAQTYGVVDSNQKTVTVPAGSLGLTGKIKTRLAADGWAMSVYEGPTATTGSIGPSTSLRTSDTFNTRYNLLIDWEQFDICLNLQAMVRFDISLIDNNTGSEIATLSGSGCADDVATEFSQMIKKR